MIGQAYLRYVKSQASVPWKKKEKKKLATKYETVFARGKVNWFKMIGEPRPNYEGTAREWTAEFEVSDDLRKALKAQKLTDRIKENKDGVEFIRLKQKEFNSRGEANAPVPIVDRDGKTPWDGRLLGNGSVIDVKLSIADFGAGKKKAIYPQKFRVVDHVEYGNDTDFEALDPEPKEDAKHRQKDTFKEDFGLDDELPL